MAFLESEGVTRGSGRRGTILGGARGTAAFIKIRKSVVCSEVDGPRVCHTE